ncbi:MAG TPA: DUF2914 domain-containing protein, partial [Vicinamibacterales bacterium]
QEASLGPRHPDLANTLNNLGIVCEMTDKPDEAEQYFRRAVSIARTSLPADHPFVATSQQNLRDFCEARGKKVEMPAPLPKPAQEPPTPAQKLLMPAQELPRPGQKLLMAASEIAKPAPELPKPAHAVAVANEPEPEEAEDAAKRLFYRFAVGALGPIAMLMVVLAAGLPRLWPQEPEAHVPEVLVDSRPAVAAPSEPAPVDAIAKPEETTPALTAPPPVTPTPPPPTTTTKASSEEVDEASTKERTPTSPSTSPVVVLASLCAELDDWLCDPADRPVPSGPLFFYTQIKSASATSIQHRWYQDDRLKHAVTLPVQANRSGYRTFSRSLMTSDSAGSWRVEVRSEDGALLHVERFTVR